MATLLDQPLHAFLEGPAGQVSPQGEAFVVRVASLAYQVAADTPPAALTRALASGSATAFLRELVALVLARGVSTPEAEARLRGELAISEALERTGGLWRADEAQTALRVSRAALHAWRSTGRVLALPLADGSFGYPVAQFVPAAADTAPPRPHPALPAVLAAAGRLTPYELFGLLATAQPALAAADAPDRPRTGFEALRAGDGPHVVDLLIFLTTVDDAGAPAANAPAVDSAAPAHAAPAAHTAA